MRCTSSYIYLFIASFSIASFSIASFSIAALFIAGCAEDERMSCLSDCLLDGDCIDSQVCHAATGCCLPGCTDDADCDRGESCVARDRPDETQLAPGRCQP